MLGERFRQVIAALALLIDRALNSYNLPPSAIWLGA
jgi:hypothetical protein